MSQSEATYDVQQLLGRVNEAVTDNQLTLGAAENIRDWLTKPAYRAYIPQIAAHVEQGDWKTLDDVFWTVIPFGTGGRRGRMYPIGSNAINERTIGESAQGLASYVRQTRPTGPWSCAIAYDTRHRSREFAELCASIMVGNDIDVYFIDEYRSTPELSFLIRHKQCDCGIMVTASHNPPSDNAVKVYWSNGAQLIPPHDQRVIEEVGKVEDFKTADFQEAVSSGRIKLCTKEIDDALLGEHEKCSFGGPRDLRVIYSPLHGVGEFNVKALLHAVGFHELEIFEPHREPSGDFPNVPGHVSNPENPAVFDAIINRARETGAELILATDPDGDRMGAAAPKTLDPHGPWSTITGNQLGVLLADYVLRQLHDQHHLRASHYIVMTLVTTMMIDRLADAYGVRCLEKHLVGFKWIGNAIDREGPMDFIFGAEESHGYLVGTYARDKDGVVACMLMCELAAKCKAEGRSLFDQLDHLYQKHGYHAERLLTITMKGSDGMKRMQSLMEKLRHGSLTSIGGMGIAAVRDYRTGRRRWADGHVETIEGPTGDLVMMDSKVEGNYVAVRPSGTEPKVKMYMFTYVPPNEIEDLDDCRVAMNSRLDQMEKDLDEFAESVPG